MTLPRRIAPWRRVALLLFTALAGGCEQKAPSAPTPAAGPSAPNQPPQMVATVTPATGIDDLTTFTTRIEVTDPEGHRVTVTAWGVCDLFPKDTPIELKGNVAVLTFKSTWKCGPSLMLTATDAKGSSTRVHAAAEHKGLGGPLRIVLGDGFYDQPVYWTTLTQSGTTVTGTISDTFHAGAIDPLNPGTIDEDGRFRLRFRIPPDPDDLVLAGQLIAPRGGDLTDNVIAVGQVIGRRHAGRAFRLWNESVY